MVHSDKRLFNNRLPEVLTILVELISGKDSPPFMNYFSGFCGMFCSAVNVYLMIYYDARLRRDVLELLGYAVSIPASGDKVSVVPASQVLSIIKKADISSIQKKQVSFVQDANDKLGSEGLVA